MLLSIIVPIYNKSKYLKKCIDSLIFPSNFSYEIILINDGSTDSSYEICKDLVNYYKNDPIKFYSQENRGVSNTRNYGLKIASGKYVMFMDADDYIDKNIFYSVFDILENYEPDIVFSNIRKVDENDNLIIEHGFPFGGYVNNLSKFYETFEEIQRTTGLYGYVSNKIIKSSILKKYNIFFNEEISLAEDFDFYLRIYPNLNNCYYYDNSYLNYLQNADFSSSKKQLMVTPNYIIQANILYKEYMFLYSKGITNLINLRVKICNYLIFYLKENYIENSEQYPLKKIINLEYLNLIIFNNRSVFDKILLIELKKRKTTLLSIQLKVYGYLKKLYHFIKKGSKL